ncbi:MAG: hypothetical protein A3C93_03385 [Candidatus Lloydbacteria bacterium RIFCSPHIGHO2_02_FULL_54_17]|uniref:Haloacid dehalogenase n=1 Tax=Candidatus Lloydbacteria bacterium RIFCSPHIGHO2_02_FULL_54_17 TaxID=1798664 RepID=A0A1G2DFE0_9BACT|nr:MAG: hypothetical protein A2762_00985 [Candidatus Lloydbacteria bacterium RIFCSPHIGHO2_01_FULL_54_11]OGZ12329.1 MAG: hypothetical protein A3C93_03385 [Candidatus Lloydbacteria bacterium RIFCSPHIGHO2_02_FULL_54_17]OGZ14578.1 MAG: hypothetical protein A2948_05735 [Candidatus Lloydbacteria bacterium RIFCSPLOWO2_01_FULL_54_18]
MKKPTIRAIFVDFGNVCATFDMKRFVKNTERAFGVSAEEIQDVLFMKAKDGGYKGYSPLFMAFECGEIGPVGFFHALTHTLHCEERVDYATFARLWVDVFDRENVELDKLLAKLPQKKYLLSNTNTLVHARHISGCAIVRNHFPTRPDRILSYEVGVVKPNPLIYKVALARAGTKPEQSLFLDDMEENIDAWRELGGVGVVYHAKNDPIAKLKKELRTLGVLK